MQEGNLFLPWYNFPLIEFLQSHLKPKMQVFEFGCGFSTLFYAQKGCNVVSFETRQEWVEKISQLGKNHSLEGKFSLHHCKSNELASSVLKQNIIFDVIVIDSCHRIECLKNAKYVYQKGIIILDNSERENLKSATNIMEGFLFREFFGNGVAREGESYATVFYKNL